MTRPPGGLRAGWQCAHCPEHGEGATFPLAVRQVEQHWHDAHPLPPLSDLDRQRLARMEQAA